MIFYHFTNPGFLMIAREGLKPNTNGIREHMTLPIVWLTTESSNAATAEDAEHIRKYGASRFRAGELIYGGPVRLTVRLEGSNLRLFRYVDFLRKHDADLTFFRERLTRKALKSWWVHAGRIPPRKVEMQTSAISVFACLDYRTYERGPRRSLRSACDIQNSFSGHVPR